MSYKVEIVDKKDLIVQLEKQAGQVLKICLMIC